jgi:inner membrane protein
MDNLTHTLTGIALSQAGLNRKTRFATLALIVGSNAPDVDIVSRLGGSVAYLQYHRGITHSFLGVTVLAAVLTALIYYPGRRARSKPSAPRLDGRWLFGVCWIATLGHLLLDFTNAYGIRPFLPFSGKWYAWGIMPIVDPLLLLVLAAGLGLPALLRLVSEEVGAHKPGYRGGAIAALVVLLLLWGLRDATHRRVLNLLSSENYGEAAALRVGAFPIAINPFAWTGVVETDSAFYVLGASALDSAVDTDRAEVFHKPEPSPALEAALQTRLGRVFSDFARFSWAQVEANEDGFEVTIRDLRFAGSSPQQRAAFVATIELDRNLGLRSESFSFVGKSSE